MKGPASLAFRSPFHLSEGPRSSLFRRRCGAWSTRPRVSPLLVVCKDGTYCVCRDEQPTMGDSLLSRRFAVASDSEAGQNFKNLSPLLRGLKDIEGKWVGEAKGKKRVTEEPKATASLVHATSCNRNVMSLPIKKRCGSRTASDACGFLIFNVVPHTNDRAPAKAQTVQPLPKAKRTRRKNKH